MKNILLIDDDVPNLTTWKQILEMSGYSVVVATNGMDGMKASMTPPLPDLIVCDRNMPGLDGLTLCKALRQNEMTKTLPIIFLTALASEEERREGMEAEANDYLVKPIHPRTLIKAIEVRFKMFDEQKRRYEILKERIKRAIPDYLINAANGSYGSASELLEEIKQIQEIPPELIELLEDNRESAYQLALTLQELVNKDFDRILKSS